MPAKLLGKTFLDWSNYDVRPHFWDRLSEAIQTPTTDEQNTIVLTEVNENLNDLNIEHKNIEPGERGQNRFDLSDDQESQTNNEIVNELDIDSFSLNNGDYVTRNDECLLTN